MPVPEALLTVYSTQFCAATPATGVTTKVYTVPEGFIAVLRTVSGYADVANATCYVYINGPISPPVLGAVPWSTTGDTHLVLWNGYQVFNSGDEIWVNMGGAHNTVMMSGYLLPAP